MTIKKWHGPAMLARIRSGALRGVVTGIGIVEDRAVILITGPPKTGRTYRRRGIVHQASAPGEAPASDTSILVNSRRIVLNEAAIKATLLFSAKYAAYLEHGTRHMEPRPFARRALYETYGQVVAAIAGEIRSELK